jgi:hypothetical protein
VNETVVSSPRCASDTGWRAGSTRQPSGSGSTTLPVSASRPARTRKETVAGWPFGNSTDQRVGVTVAGGTMRNGRMRSPCT